MSVDPIYGSLTPHTMGSLLVYTCSAMTLSLQGNTATCLNCSFFCLTSSAWNSVNLNYVKAYNLSMI